MRIAVVGAGPAGLVSLYTIQKRLLASEDCDHVDVVCFERKDHVGGEWYFSDQEDSSTYEGLRMNTPRPFTDLHIDYPWPFATKTFPSREEFLKYINMFAEEFDLKRYIQFNKSVDIVMQNKSTGLFDVKVSETGNRSNTSTQSFDFVLMCSGQHRKLVIPNLELSADFDGEILHYHDLDDPSRFFGKRVLVIGSSFAAMDLEIILAKKCQKFYLSWRKHTPFWFEPNEANRSGRVTIVKPKVIEAFGNTVTFADNSQAEVDAIIYATGFHQAHPLTGDLDLDFNQIPCLFPIYKHVVHPSHTKLFFVGKAYAHIIPLLRLQAEFACAVIGGKVQLPSEEEMQLEISKFNDKWIPELMKENDYTKYCPVLHLEVEIANDIAESIKCEPIRPYTTKLFYASFRIMRENCFEFRNRQLKKDWEKIELDDGIFE